MISKEYIDGKIRRLSEVEKRLSDPATAVNQKLFRDLVKEHSRLKRLSEKASRFFQLQTDIKAHTELISSEADGTDLRTLAEQELLEMKNSFPMAEKALFMELLPPDTSDARNAIMEIRAGTGGSEAALFAGDLFRMYSRYIQNKGWKISPIDASPGDVGGYKEIIFSVDGDGAYGNLKFESGGHRVQRVPDTEASGRIHTSAATVAVFPEAEPEDDIQISPEDIRIDIFCSSGPGGQSVNTTYSAIRITHLPTGTVAQSQDERSQHRNKEKALSVLKARLLDVRRREEEEKKGSFRRSQIGSGDRNERIRTYNFPQNRLTDHRINLTLYSLDRIIQGELGGLISELNQNDVQTRLAEELKKQADG